MGNVAKCFMGREEKCSEKPSWNVKKEGVEGILCEEDEEGRRGGERRGKGEGERE